MVPSQHLLALKASNGLYSKVFNQLVMLNLLASLSGLQTIKTSQKDVETTVTYSLSTTELFLTQLELQPKLMLELMLELMPELMPELMLELMSELKCQRWKSLTTTMSMNHTPMMTVAVMAAVEVTKSTSTLTSR